MRNGHNRVMVESAEGARDLRVRIGEIYDVSFPKTGFNDLDGVAGFSRLSIYSTV